MENGRIIIFRSKREFEKKIKVKLKNKTSKGELESANYVFRIKQVSDRRI
jgi:hypothetical protein